MAGSFLGGLAENRHMQRGAVAGVSSERRNAKRGRKRVDLNANTELRFSSTR